MGRRLGHGDISLLKGTVPFGKGAKGVYSCCPVEKQMAPFLDQKEGFSPYNQIRKHLNLRFSCLQNCEKFPKTMANV